MVVQGFPPWCLLAVKEPRMCPIIQPSMSTCACDNFQYLHIPAKHTLVHQLRLHSLAPIQRVLSRGRSLLISVRLHRPGDIPYLQHHQALGSAASGTSSLSASLLLKLIVELMTAEYAFRQADQQIDFAPSSGPSAASTPDQDATTSKASHKATNSRLKCHYIAPGLPVTVTRASTRGTAVPQRITAPDPSIPCDRVAPPSPHAKLHGVGSSSGSITGRHYLGQLWGRRACRVICSALLLGWRG
jgi:hypothetical protein